MNKLFTKIASAFVGIAMAVGVGVALGVDNKAEVVSATPTVYKTALFGSSYNSKGVQNYTSTWTATNSADNFTVSLSNFNNNNNGWEYVKTGNKSNASVGTISTSSVIDESITKIDITIDAITSGSVNSIKLYSSSDNSNWTEEGSYSKAKGTISVSLTSPSKNLYYKIEFDCAKGSSNGLVTVSKVEYYYEPKTDTPEISLNPSALSFVTTDTGKTVTVTPNDVFEGTPTISVEGTPSYVTSSVNGLVVTFTPKAIGKETVTIKAVYNSQSATATLNVEVIDSHGHTPDDPFSVADVISLIDEDTTKIHSGVYVAGIICQIDSFNEKYGSITY